MLAGCYAITRGDIATHVEERVRRTHEHGRVVLASAHPMWLLGCEARCLFDRNGLSCALDGQVDNLLELAELLGLETDDPGTVLAHGWRSWAEAMLERLRGTFVVAIWDVSQRRGMIAVDQLGNRAAYYCGRGGGLIFASEVAELLALLDQRPEPDPVHLAHWLSFTDPPAGRTLYSGVERLSGGSVLRLANGRWTRVSYWPPRAALSSTSSREEAAARLRARLEQAIRRTIRGDRGEAGVLLSGGLDSATVAGLAGTRTGQGRLRSYSATFPGLPSADESTQIAELADRYGLVPFGLAVARGSAVGGSIEFLERTQLPPSSPNLFFWLPLLRQAAADGIRVVLDGEGGDELFAAARYLPADRLRHGRALEAFRMIMRLPGAGAGPPRRQVLRVAAEYALRGALPGPVRRGAARLGWGAVETPFWLSPATATLHRATADADGWMAAAGPRWRAWLLHTVRDSTGGPQLARDHVRQRTRMAGLLDRHPLLDVDVVDFMLDADPELSFDPYLDRPLVREAMTGLLPDSVRLRTAKTSFDAPFQQSLTRELTSISALLCDPGSELRAYVDLEVVRREVIDRPGARFALGGRAWALALWRLVTAELWLRLQRDPDAPQTAIERCGFPAVALERA